MSAREDSWSFALIDRPRCVLYCRKRAVFLSVPGCASESATVNERWVTNTKGKQNEFYRDSEEKQPDVNRVGVTGNWPGCED